MDSPWISCLFLTSNLIQYVNTSTGCAVFIKQLRICHFTHSFSFLVRWRQRSKQWWWRKEAPWWDTNLLKRSQISSGNYIYYFFCHCPVLSYFSPSLFLLVPLSAPCLFLVRWQPRDVTICTSQQLFLTRFHFPLLSIIAKYSVLISEWDCLYYALLKVSMNKIA